MPRRPRIKVADMPMHVIQRGNNRSACFYADEDYVFYLNQLVQASTLEHVSLHAYCLMTNHVHLLLTPQDAGGVSRMMKRLGQRYVQYVNRTYRRSGTLWEGRFRSSLVGEEEYLLGCYRYIELNPVRAGMVTHPADYRWSSYRVNAEGEHSDWLTPHVVFRRLGMDEGSRQASYRQLFQYQLDPSLVDEIRIRVNSGYALGSTRFQQEIADALGCRASPGRPGRPTQA